MGDENAIYNKDLYEVLVDLSIYIIVKLAGGSVFDSQLNGPKEFAVDQVDTSGDLLAHLVAVFVKHIRDHEKLSNRRQDK